MSQGQCSLGLRKKDTIEFGKANLQPLGANVPSFIGLAYQGKKDVVFRFISYRV
jgi:hypothetical protein